MTLKEKFINAITIPFSYEVKIDESIKIADEFAIGFAEWLLVEKYSDLKEVLEIYKKEKGL